ncbi:MAG: UDP-N-acetylglucosamine--N-acetylmuramyl-(pentapeptide) pyrophosphoryl-undecaprenol N-acetylglucosamine transferase [Chloroflexota bacterium]|nr:MAG: UDP-N-acetylglucosamine--N-acetylmuramyl-(pentapeptide) pyrophosphoryl-undecaprenol N-acetylglucosamine transferase [Chloroflexota bacterium]
MRLLIAAGGTGGHVYPALAVAERLLHITTDSTIAFVGTVGGFERLLLEKSDVPLESIDEVQAGPLHGVNPLKVVTSIFKTLAGIVQSWRILGLRKPNVVLMTGGWVGLPVAVAAWLRRVPIVIFLPDIEPALSIKILRPFAKTIAVTTEASAQYVPESKMIVTGYPLRQSVAGAQRRQAVEHFGLDTAKKTLLVFGGSRGARSINIGLIDALPDLLAKGDLQIIHVTGELDAQRAEAVRGTPGYHPYAYLHDDMGLAMAAADLCVCRSGASTLGELPYFGLPALLVPYPHAWRYQKVNADYLAQRGAAQILPDESLGELASKVRALLDAPGKLANMRAAALALRCDDAAGAIAELLLKVGAPR